MRIFVLRHAESENAVAGTAGALPEAPLTDAGRRQAADAAALLGAEGIGRIYASTAVRARDTAAIIADVLGVDTVTLPELVEFGIGTKEGAHDPETRAQTAATLRAWVVDRDLDARVADGETGHEVVARVGAAMDTIAANHPGRTVAVVGHVGSLTAWLAIACDLGDRLWGTPLPHAVPFLVEWDGRGWRCQTPAML